MREGLLVVVFAALLRAIVFTQLSDTVVFENLVGDGAMYLAKAKLILKEGWLGKEIFYQAPLYPYFLAAVETIFGAGVIPILALQMIGGVFASVAVCITGTLLWSRAVGLIAGLFVAAYPSILFSEFILEKNALGNFLLCGFLCAFSFALKNKKTAPAIFAGVFWGLLCLTFENAQLGIFAIPLFGLYRKNYRLTALFTLGLVAPLLLVASRNYHVSGRFVLSSSQLGTNLYYGNGAKSDGTYTPLLADRGAALFESKDARLLAEKAADRPLAADEVSAYWVKRTLSEIGENPRRWVELMGRKILLYANYREIADTQEEAMYEDFSSLFYLLRRGLNFALLFVLATAGWILSRRERETHWLALIGCTFLVGTIAFLVLARYRYYQMPILSLFAASALVGMYHAIRNGELRCWRPALIGGGLAGVLTFVPMIHATPKTIGYTNHAIAFLRQGNLKEAGHFFRTALAIDPSNTHAFKGLFLDLPDLSIDEAKAFFARATGTTQDPHRLSDIYLISADFFLSHGQVEGAEKLAMNALTYNSTNTEAQCLVARLAWYSHQADPINAIESALLRDPFSWRCRYYAGVYFTETGQFAKARENLEMAADLFADNHVLQFALGKAYLELGEPSRARVSLERSLKISPSFQLAQQEMARLPSLP